MKILFLNTYDAKGGAGRGAYRHHKGFQRAGIKSLMLVQQKQTNDESVILHPQGLSERLLAKVRNLDPLPVIPYIRHRPFPWSVGWLDNNLSRSVNSLDADLIHLHWVGHGFVPVHALGDFGKPIVWQLADPWAFTGGCHYPGECTRYQESCGRCPRLGSRKENDLSRRTWTEKTRFWAGLDLTVVVQSQWMRKCATSSSLFGDVPVEVIPAGIDENEFCPQDRDQARRAEDLPLDKKLILTGAIKSTTDPRKGFTMLKGALQSMARSGTGNDVELFVFGGGEESRQPLDLGLKTTYLGHVADERLRRLYAAADVFVSPAVEEAFGQTVLEAMASGTPCAGFNIGGIKDMIDHKENGYLAIQRDPEDLAAGLVWILSDENRRRRLAAEARSKMERLYVMDKVASRYKKLYEDIISRSEASMNERTEGSV